MSNDDQDSSKLFKAHIYMDFKNPDKGEIIVTRRAPSKLDVKRQLEDRLNPGRDQSIVSLVDADGELHMIHTMKFGYLKVEEVEK